MPKLDIKKDTIIYSSVQTRPEGGRAVPAQVRVLSTPHKGKVTLHVREFYVDYDTGNYAPGRGVKFPQEALEEIIKGLLIMQETLKEEENAQSLHDPNS